MNRKLVASAAASAALISLAMYFVPPPVNYITSLAICGPLSAAVLGLLHERRLGRRRTA